MSDLMLPNVDKRRDILHGRCLACVFAAWVCIAMNVSWAQQTVDPFLKRMDITIENAGETVLAQHPLLRFQQAQVSLDEGLRLQASGLFDTGFTSELSQQWFATPLTQYQAQSNGLSVLNGAAERSSQGTLTSNVTRMFRTGVSVNATLELQRVLDDVSSIGGNNFSAFNLAVNIPLLRNRGRKAVAAQEWAAISEVKAAKQDLNQEASALLENVAVSYWGLVASQKNLDIAAASEDRARTYLANVETLVEADQIPKNDLHELQANLAQRSATRIIAEQSVVASQQQLVLDMGLDASKLNNLSLRASEEFPATISATLFGVLSEDIPDFMVLALARRGDYLSAQQRLAEQQALTRAAQNRLAPQLDLALNAGYSGLQAGRKFFNLIDAVGTAVPGPNAGAAITFSFPPQNDVARGQLLQASSIARQIELQSEQIQHEILTEVVTSLGALVHNSEAVEQTSRAVAAAQASLDGEREKYRVGMGSVVDLVTIEDRLNAALSNQVQAQTSYAMAVSQLRYATATFVDQNSASFILRPHAFQTIPDLISPPDGRSNRRQFSCR